MSILVVGSVALDSIETPFGRVIDAVGGSAVHFSAAASFFSKVSLIGVVGDDFPFAEIDFLKDRGVDLTGLQVQKGATFRWRGRYQFDLNTAETLETQLNVFADFSPVIPEPLRCPDLLFLGNIHPLLQRRVLEQIERPCLVALDTMNFWIEKEKEALCEVIGMVDLVVINEAEARQLAGDPSLAQAARTIRGWMPRSDRPHKLLVIKRGEYGALLFDGDEIFAAPGLPLETVRDPTGAGDSFAGGLIGYLASAKTSSGGRWRQAVIVGSAVASFNVEDFGCRRLMILKKTEINERLKTFRELGRFEEISL